MPAGRKPKLTPELSAKICDAIQLCYSIEAAAALAGVHPSTIYRWKERGAKARSGIYKRFCEELDIAEGLAEGHLTMTARSLAMTDGKFALTLMSRKWPRKWARRVYKPQDEGTGGSLTVVFRRPDPKPDAAGDDISSASQAGGPAADKGPPPGPGRKVVAKDEARKGNGNGGNGG